MATLNPKLSIYNKVRINPRINSNLGWQSEKEPDLDGQISRLEDEIRRLKVDFDIYLNGGAKRPPHESRGRVESLIKRIGDSRLMRYAQRYRYNTIVARYNAYREMWRRLFRQRGYEFCF